MRCRWHLQGMVGVFGAMAATMVDLSEAFEQDLNEWQVRPSAMYGGFGLEKCSQIQQTIQVGELVELQDNLVCAGILLVIGGVGGRRGLCRGSDNAAKVDFLSTVFILTCICPVGKVSYRPT